MFFLEGLTVNWSWDNLLTVINSCQSIILLCQVVTGESQIVYQSRIRRCHNFNWNWLGKTKTNAHYDDYLTRSSLSDVESVVNFDYFTRKTFIHRFYLILKNWMSIQRALLCTHFMSLLEELTHSKFRVIR